MDKNKRVRGAEAYLLALRTGEVPATQEAGKYLAKDVQLFGAPGANGPTRRSTSRVSGPRPRPKATN